jgi:hypothetical protein
MTAVVRIEPKKVVKLFSRLNPSAPGTMTAVVRTGAKKAAKLFIASGPSPAALT